MITIGELRKLFLCTILNICNGWYPFFTLYAFVTTLLLLDMCTDWYSKQGTRATGRWLVLSNNNSCIPPSRSAGPTTIFPTIVLVVEFLVVILLQHLLNRENIILKTREMVCIILEKWYESKVLYGG